MESSCLKFEQSKAILLKLQPVESLWVSGTIPGICDTLIVMLFPGKPAVPSCRVLAAGLALWRRSAGQEAVTGLWGDSWWELAVFDCPGSRSPFPASVTAGQRVLGVGWKQTLDRSVAYWLSCPQTSVCRTLQRTRGMVPILITRTGPACPTREIN